jgi:hypothetical protein
MEMEWRPCTVCADEETHASSSVLWGKMRRFLGKLQTHIAKGQRTYVYTIKRVPLDEEEYEGLVAALKGVKGGGMPHLAEQMPGCVSPVLEHATKMLENMSPHVFHYELVMWLLMGLAKEVTSTMGFLKSHLVRHYWPHAAQCLHAIELWPSSHNNGHVRAPGKTISKDDVRRLVFEKIVSMDDVWRLVFDAMRSDHFNDNIEPIGILHYRILVHNPPGLHLLREFMVASNKLGLNHLDRFLARAFCANPAYERSIPTGALDNMSTILLDECDYRRLCVDEQRSAIRGVMRVAESLVMIEAQGTMSFVTNTVLPVLRESTINGCSLITRINNHDVNASRPLPSTGLHDLLDGVWDLPLCRLFVSIRCYSGFETFGEMVRLFSGFYTRSKHGRRPKLMGGDL